MKTEQELQLFIAENPWLINLNYEIVPDLPNNGIEFRINNQRIDLILRDKISKCPVILEFKFVNFYRENIGQILEYKTRIISTLNKNENILYEIFKEFVLCPKLILIVQECDDFFRIACNISGIELFEFKNLSNILSDPTSIRSIKNFSESYKNDPVPLTKDRYISLEKLVYNPIKSELQSKNLLNTWREPRGSYDFFIYYLSFNFINRWIFKENLISMGIYEDIYSIDEIVTIAYFSYDQSKLKEFNSKYYELKKEQPKFHWNETNHEGSLEINFDRKDFFNNVKEIFKRELEIYLKCIN